MQTAVDHIQQRLTDYACRLDYDALPAQVIHAAKVRIIDTLGALIGGFFEEPCHSLRHLAALAPNSNGATIVGTRMKASPDMAAFVNCTTARCAELSDVYEWPGSFVCHPSDVVMAALTAAEHAQASGRELITAVVLGYEVIIRIADVITTRSFDHTNLSCLGSAIAAGKLLGLSPIQLAHCISMAAVPNVALAQVRRNHKSVWKAVAAGHAARAGVFAALLARAGMEGPHLPFEGKAGWCEHVAQKRFSLDTLGGGEIPFKILDTFIKMRPSGANTLASILAAEKVAPLVNLADVEQISIEVYKWAKERFTASDSHYMNPNSRETADHSIPYTVAATLLDGTITSHSFNPSHLENAQLRALMRKIEIVENEQFRQAYRRLPIEHRARITVVMRNGERVVGESGGDHDDLSAPKSDAQIEEKFYRLTENLLGTRQVKAILNRLWQLEALENAAEIAPAFGLS